MYDVIKPTEQSGTKRLLISAAAQLFYRHGYALVTVDDICTTATGSFTKGAFYHFFKSKEEILFAINVAYLEHCIDLVRSFESSMPADKKFHLLARNSKKLLLEKREYVVVANQEIRFLTGEYRKTVIGLRKSFRNLVEAIVSEGQRDGIVLKKLDPKIVTMNYFGMLNWIYVWFRPDGSLGAGSVINAFESQFLRGISAGP